jgi:hypothetical protein
VGGARRDGTLGSQCVAAPWTDWRAPEVRPRAPAILIPYGGHECHLQGLRRCPQRSAERCEATVPSLRLHSTRVRCLGDGGGQDCRQCRGGSRTRGERDASNCSLPSPNHRTHGGLRCSLELVGSTRRSGRGRRRLRSVCSNRPAIPARAEEFDEAYACPDGTVITAHSPAD